MTMQDPAPVTRFSGSFAFLGNPYPCPVEGPEDGITYPSAEHCFAASKGTLMSHRMRIAAMPDWRTAKMAGRQVELREGWDEVRREVMLHILLAKFKGSPELMEKLAATGERILIEGNTWGDDYWGMVERNGRWEGENYLGRLLMAVRMTLA